MWLNGPKYGLYLDLTDLPWPECEAPRVPTPAAVPEIAKLQIKKEVKEVIAEEAESEEILSDFENISPNVDVFSPRPPQIHPTIRPDLPSPLDLPQRSISFTPGMGKPSNSMNWSTSLRSKVPLLIQPVIRPCPIPPSLIKSPKSLGQLLVTPMTAGVYYPTQVSCHENQAVSPYSSRGYFGMTRTKQGRIHLK